jgi:hypothetical protein
VHVLEVSSEGNAVERTLQAGARAVREPHDFPGGRLRTGWVLAAADNLVEVVQQRR